MKSQSKHFIFTSLSDAPDAPLTNKIKTFREASYLHLPLRVGTWGQMFLRGLFICLCFLTAHNSILHSDRDKGACNRYTSAFPVVGSGQSGRRRSGENKDSLFVRAFSSFLFSYCFRFSFLHFLF